jgi:hypothetical protein
MLSKITDSSKVSINIDYLLLYIVISIDQNGSELIKIDY